HCSLLVSNRLRAVAYQHRPEALGPAEYVDVHVHHILAPDVAGVDDRAKTVAGTLLARELPREGKDPAERLGVVRRRLVEGRHVALGHHQEMHRRPRRDVVERDDVVILVNLPARDLAPNDLAEDAVRIVSDGGHAHARWSDSAGAGVL